MDQNEIQKKEEALRKASLLQQLQEERKKLDSQIRSRSDLLKNLEASQRVDRILEVDYGNLEQTDIGYRCFCLMDQNIG